MRLLLLLLLLLAVPLAAAATPEGPDPERLAAAIAGLPAGWERTRAASAAFLGVPYAASPLGEGGGVDADPRIRFDAVDCLTFVETSLALGNGADLDEARALLDDIRYREGTPPAFENRLHLMIAQWIPDQIRKGYLEDVTARYGPTEIVRVAYDEARWAARPRALRDLPWTPALAGTFDLPMIPIDRARAIAGSLPEGLVINVVRSARPDRLNRITHTGFVIVHDGAVWVRHASLGRRAVVDEPIDAFLARHARMRRWTVEGIHLLAVRDNGARLARLAAIAAGAAAGETPTDATAAVEDAIAGAAPDAAPDETIAGAAPAPRP